jgi:hypothetical protein
MIDSKSLVVRLGLSLLLVACAALVIEIPTLLGTHAQFKTQKIEKSMLDRGSLGKLFRESGLIRLQRQRARVIPGPVNGARLAFTIKLSKPATFVLFWADAKKSFSRENSTTIELGAGTFDYVVGIPGLESLSQLRFDFADNQQVIEFGNVSISESGYRSISLTTKEFEKAVVATRQLQLIDGTHNMQRYRSTGRDPNLLFSIERLSLQKNLFSKMFDKRTNSSDRHYTTVTGGEANFPSNLAENLLSDAMPVLSIQVHQDDLYDTGLGLLKNRQARGPESERAASITWYEDRQAVFSSSVGIRFHGGQSRNRFESYRLYFGKSRGSSRNLKNRIFDNRVTLKTLVVHHTDWPKSMPLNNVLGFEVCRQLKCAVGEFKLALVYLNGEKQGVFYIVEHQSHRQWSTRLSTPVKHLYRFKSDNTTSDNQAFWSAYHYATDTDTSLSMRQVSEVFDIDNLTRHMLAQYYVANADYCQGIAVLNDRDEAKWHYVAWDMDHGFAYRPDQPHLAQRTAWQEGGIERAFSKTTRCPRADLMKRLFTEDPLYVSFFAMTLADALNFQLGEKQMLPVVARYLAQLEAVENRKFAKLEQHLTDFVTRRPDFLRAEAQRVLGLGAVHKLVVEQADDDTTIYVNGYAISDNSKLRYFQNQQIDISGRLKNGDAIAKWQINNIEHRGAKISLTITEDLIVSASLQ